MTSGRPGTRVGMRSKAELALITVTLLWGTTFVVVKNALADISPLLFIALRFSLAAIAMIAIYAGTLRRDGISRRALRAGLFAGSLLFAAFTLQTIGLGLTTPSKSAFLTSLSIPMVPLTSSLVYKARPRLLEVIGVVIASTGMILLTFPGRAFAGGFEMSRGDFLSFLCAVLFALHIVVIGHFAPLLGYEPLAVIQIAMVAMLAGGSFWFGETVRLNLSPSVSIAVVVTGLLATALAFTTMAWAQQYTSATRTALIFALEPVAAWFTSWLLTGERIDSRGRIGAGLILAGILLVEVKPGWSKAG